MDLLKKEYINDLDLMGFLADHPACMVADMNNCNQCVELSSLITEAKIFCCSCREIYKYCDRKNESTK